MKKKQRRFLSGEKVAFLHYETGNIEEGIFARYADRDEDDVRDEYWAFVEYKGVRVKVIEDYIYKRSGN